ncbi:uncharacterized protein LOC135171442 [Diachasmimorpha longicaudata]|uniref:uncharacterized protein LOC135171442 n=1 Tax=Diachasmimorpha longicaudata TaxID=58733 RepID=UPI0030B8F873
MNTPKGPAEAQPRVWPQWAAALIIHVLAVIVGLAIGSTSPFLAKLTRGDGPIIITDHQASWMASLVSITRPIGAVIAAIVARKFGSKMAVLIGGIPHAIAWSCLLKDNSVVWIYGSRIMSGFGLGMYYSTFPLYIGEISTPRIRGALISFVVQGLAIGTLLGNVLGAYVDMTTFAVISLILTAIFFFSFLFFPDSPYYLVSNDRVDEAEKALMWFSCRRDVKDAVEGLKGFVGLQPGLTFTESFRQLTVPVNRKVVVIVLLVYVLMQMAGLFTIALYMEILLISLKVDVLPPSLVVVLAGVVAMVASLLSMYTSDRFGRRVMLVTSCVGVTTTLFLLGVNCLLIRGGDNDPNLQWVSIIAMILYQFSVYIGMLPVSNCLMGELFPPQLREIGPCLANVTSGAFAFIMSKSYQPILNSTSEEFVFWFHAVFAFVMIIFTVRVVPETKGKSLREIQELMRDGGSTDAIVFKTKMEVVEAMVEVDGARGALSGPDGALALAPTRRHPGLRPSGLLQRHVSPWALDYRRIPRLIVRFVVHLLAVLDGLVGGWTSPYLAKLTTGRESLTITRDEASWIASLYLASQPVGSIFAAVIVRKVGARKAVLWAGVPHAVGWLCFLVYESVPLIYLARILNGSGFGMYYSTFPLYIGEIGNPKIRGSLVGVVAQGTGIGYLIGNVLGAFLTMKMFAVVGFTMSCVFMLSFFLIPDSSHYLVMRNRLKEAEESLRWYNCKTDVSEELQDLMAFIGEPRRMTIREMCQAVLGPVNRRIVMIVIGVHVMMHLSGVYVVSMYLEILVSRLKIDVMLPSSVVILVSIAAIAGGLATTYTNDRVGRQTMMAVAAFGLSAIFILIGVNFLLVKCGYDMSAVQWLIVIEFMVLLFLVNVGLAIVPCCLVSEIFPPEIKEFGSCIVNVTSAIAAFTSGKSYQPILDATSEEFMFFFYASILFGMFIYTIVVVPETKGKSLQEIQDMLMRRDQGKVKVGN